MQKRISTPQLDVVQNARRIVEASTQTVTSPSLISQVMAEMGRKGGLIGGKRRLTTLTGKRRREIAVKAAKIRWAKKK